MTDKPMRGSAFLDTAERGRYPIPLRCDDFRFGFALSWAVAGVLAEFDYPDIHSGYDGALDDFERLQQALYAFLYHAPTPARSPQGGDLT